MGEPTPNLLLKQWAATDEKITTWTDYNNNLLAIDEKITKLIENAQTVLWTGAGYPPAASTITPTKKLSECKNGWILRWSDYDPGVGSNDYDFYESPVFKQRGVSANGKSEMFEIPTSLSATTSSYVNKRLYIYDDKIVGHDDNSVGGNGSSASYGSNDVVLREIVEF
ncbi:hypothetical protein SAMN05444673_2595 [Bacillus sp. OV166]|uniref:hypothetical protein n=1 Tax=Bacillus sp. OV166 TaxID=1882763 RepID=UPI000A2ABD6D|nr:hypothetical protein [Bacillus sp. OV166]SMQ75977.1 hypothetical protein SAMN05444673_2595 [Bacillus sp. OV166]